MYFDFLWVIINFAALGLIVWVIFLAIRYFKSNSKKLDELEEKIDRMQRGEK